MSPLEACPRMRWRGEMGMGLDRPGRVIHMLRSTCRILEPLKRTGSCVSATLESSTALTSNRWGTSVRSPSRDTTLISHSMPGSPPPRAWSESLRMLWASGTAPTEAGRTIISKPNILLISTPFVSAIASSTRLLTQLNVAQRINDVFLRGTSRRHVCRQGSYYAHQQEREQGAHDVQVDQ